MYNRLFVNDSLTILYILSSTTATWFILYMLIFGFYLILNKTIYVISCWSVFIILKYFITAHNKSLIFNIFGMHNINTNLQNGLLNIHPPIIYYIYSFTFCIWILLYFCKKNHSSIKLRVNLAFIICILGVLLGALWAAQELNWGGFWSWDPVELTSLVLLNYLLYIFHINKRLFFYSRSFLPGIIIIFLIYSIIRLGIINTIHSFIRTNNISIYIYITMGIIFCYVIFLSKIYLTIVYHNIFVNPIKNKGVIKTSLFLFIKQMLIILLFIIYSLIFFQGVLHQDFIQIKTHQLLFIGFATLFYYSLVQINIFFLFWNFVLLLLILNKSIYYIYIITIYLVLVRYNYKYKAIHNGFALCLCLGHIYFVNLHVYANYVGVVKRFTHALNESMLQVVVNSFYENSVFLKKHFLFLMLKNTSQHLTGFNLLSNINVTGYFFSRNFKVNLLFINELILVLCYIISAVVLSIFKTSVTSNYFVNNFSIAGKYKE